MAKQMPQPKLAPVTQPKPLPLKSPQPPKAPSQATPDKSPAPPKPPEAEAPKVPQQAPKQAALPDAYHAVLRLPEYLAQLVRDRTGYPSAETPQALPPLNRPQFRRQ
jgi:hypothetical protein